MAMTNETYHTVVDPRCLLCKQHAETSEYIISGCSKLSETGYAARHNNVALIVNRTICTAYNFEHS